MKAVLLVFFLTTLYAALPCKATYGTTVDEAKDHQDAKTAMQQAGHDRAAKKIHPHGSASQAMPNHPQPPPSNQKRLETRKLSDPQRRVSSRSTSPANGMNSGVSKPRLAQPPTAPPTSIPTTGNVRHRSPNPATVGGLATSRAAHTGYLNGARMGRKP